MIRCNSCHEVFDEDDLDYDHECVGEFWGAPAYQDYPKCPECGSDDIEDFEYPYDGCQDYEKCNYDCECCPYAEKMKNEEE